MKRKQLLGLGMAMAAVLSLSANAEPYQWYDREVNLSQAGNGTMDFNTTEVRHYSHMRLHLVNPTEAAMQIEMPELERSYLVPAKSERTVVFPMLQAGEHDEVQYTVTEMKPEHPYVQQVGKTQEALMVERITQDIQQSQMALRPYVQSDETRTTARPATQQQEQRSTTVRGYW